MERKIKIGIIAFVIGIMCFGVCQCFASEAASGDVDDNGRLSVRDSLMVLQNAAGLTELNESGSAAADVDGDGVVGIRDAEFIYKKVVGEIVYFPTEKLVASGKVFIAGDSIASEHDIDETAIRQRVGWGAVIGDLFNEQAVIDNEARSGRSSMSYLTSSNYPTYITTLAKGDYFLISFGHNDEKKDDASRYTDPYGTSETKGSFKWYLKNYYIEPALKVGAFPVLVSSVVRCNFTGSELSPQSHESYVLAMEQLVEEYRSKDITIGYIDLHQMTKDYYNKVGQTEAESLHAYTATELDRTHYCEKGARLVAQFIVDDMVKQGFDISRFVK